MVNLEWFRTFKTIYETGSLTSAASQLFISQPGVSLHLNSLEAHVGNKLFDRGTRKMIPTEHGNMLYNSIVDAIKKVNPNTKAVIRTHSEEAADIFIKQGIKDVFIGEYELGVSMIRRVTEMVAKKHWKDV